MTSLSSVTGALEGEVFKRDTVGRVRVSRARRDALLEEFERSGGSGAQFAACVGVKYSTFASWVAKRRRRQALEVSRGEATPSPKGNGMRWWETVVEAPGKGLSAAGVLRVQLPGGVHLEIADASQAGLAAVLLEELGRLGAKGC